MDTFQNCGWGITVVIWYLNIGSDLNLIDTLIIHDFTMNRYFSCNLIDMHKFQEFNKLKIDFICAATLLGLKDSKASNFLSDTVFIVLRAI